MPEAQESLTDRFRKLTNDAKKKILKSFSKRELEQWAYCWRAHARPNQLPPDGDWRFWLLMAGRGFGKSRVGAEWVREQARVEKYVNIIGATADDARDIMIEGESGIMAVCHRSERPTYKPHKAAIEWPNGARSLVFTAAQPERLRGKQHAKVWADELGAWRYQEAWDQLTFGLRLGNPQAVITTTPRPTRVIKELVESPYCIVTRGSTYENQKNLAPAFFSQIIKRFEGTRLGRQELNAELLTDTPGALWTADRIDALRVSEPYPVALRIAVGVDPAMGSGDLAESDDGLSETGIIVAASGADGHAYILDDRTVRGTPDVWARAVISAFHTHEANIVVAEVNAGGDMIQHTLRMTDPTVPVRVVRASRGKLVRAEPVAMLYEQGLVHHVGNLPELEDQMTTYVAGSNQKSPDRMDAMVWAMTELMPFQHQRIEEDFVLGRELESASVEW